MEYIGWIYVSPCASEADERAPDPTRLPRWKRVRKLTQIFWDETLVLLQHAQTAEMQEAVLRTGARNNLPNASGSRSGTRILTVNGRTCSSARALAWLWPFKPLQMKFLRASLNVWTQPKASASATASWHQLAILCGAKAISPRLLSFLFLRNAAAMALLRDGLSLEAESTDRRVERLSCSGKSF